MTSVVGLDLGGTKIAAVRVDVGSGTITAHATRRTAAERGSHEVLRACVALSQELSEPDTAGVALGVCELVAPDGEVQSRQTVDWIGLDLAEAFRPARLLLVESDVRAAALAEARLTSASALSSFFYVVVGTGLSSTWVCGGTPWVGMHGHAILLGGLGLEERCSGGGLQRRLGVPDLASLPDLMAHPEVHDGAGRLGRTLATVVNVLDPGAVIFGGGLGLHVPYRDAVEKALRPDISSERARSVPIRGAEAGPFAAAVGAALAGINRLSADSV